MKDAPILDKMKMATAKHMSEGTLSCKDLVEFINFVSLFVNVETVKEYADRKGISMQAAHKSKHKVELFGKAFICEW